MVAVWGTAFTRRFLDYALPTQLAEGNLPALSNLAGSVYTIATTASDEATIRADAGFARLAALVPCQFLSIDDVDRAEPYTAMTEAHRRCLQRLHPAHAAVILPPDALWSDGSFAALERLVAAGKRLVLIAGLRTRAETLEPVLAAWRAAQPGPGLTLSGRELVTLALAHLHAVSEALCWDEPRFTRWPSHLYWRVGEAGLLACAYHQHPFLVLPPPAAGPPTTTVDGEYLETLGLAAEQCHVVSDSDEVCQIEVSDRHQASGLDRLRPARLWRVAAWLRVHACPLHMRCSETLIRMHNGQSADWAQAVARAAAIRRALAWRRGLLVRLNPLFRLVSWLRVRGGAIKRRLLGQPIPPRRP
jgi:hypothetical protein